MMMNWASLAVLWIYVCSSVYATCWINNSIYQTLEEFNPSLPTRNGGFDPGKIVTGPIHQMGDFRGCLYKLEAQYCLSFVYIKPVDNSSLLWKRIEESNRIVTHYRRNKLYVGLCVPLGCNSSELRESFEETLNEASKALGVSVAITIKEEECQTKEMPPWGTAEYVVSFVLSALLICVIASSFYDGVRRMLYPGMSVKTFCGRLLMCFSVLKNWERLTTLSETNDSKSFRFIQGIRVISIYLVIMAHTLFWVIQGPIQNPEWIEESYHDIFRASFTNGNCIMGTFLSISGFLLSYFFLRDVNAKGSFTKWDFFKSVGLRYLRLTPVYVVVLAMEATLLNYAGKGPNWNHIMNQGKEGCGRTWWLHLLYIQNYFSMDTTCMGHAWYLAVDFQCYLMSMFVLILVWNFPRYSKAILGTVMCIWIFVPFIQTYVEKLDPFMMSYPDRILELNLDRTMQRIYAPFHGNAAAYFVGVIFGYIYYNIKDINFKQRKLMYAVTWIVTLAVPWPFLLMSYIFFQPSYRYDALGAASYASAYKSVFAAGISVLLTGFSLGYGWIGTTITSWKPFQYIGRLTYATYVVHFSIQKLQTGLAKEPIYLEEYGVVRMILADIVINTFLALILCLCVEMPSSALPKLFSPPESPKEQLLLSNNDSGKKDIPQMGENGKYVPVKQLHEDSEANLKDLTTSERL